MELPSTSSFPTRSQSSRLCQTHARSFIRVTNLGRRGPNTWVILCCFPSLLSGSWIGSRKVRYKPAPICNGGITGGSFMPQCSLIMLSFTLGCFSYFFLGLNKWDYDIDTQWNIFSAIKKAYRVVMIYNSDIWVICIMLRSQIQRNHILYDSFYMK